MLMHISKYLRTIFNWIQYKCDLKLRIRGAKSDNKKAQKCCFLRCNLIGRYVLGFDCVDDGKQFNSGDLSLLNNSRDCVR